ARRRTANVAACWRIPSPQTDEESSSSLMNKTLSAGVTRSAPAGTAADFHALPIGIARVRGRQIVAVNARLCELVGYTPEELVGQPTTRFYANEGEAHRVGETLYADIATHGAAACHTRLRCKDGSVIEATLTTSASGQDGAEGT